MFRGLLFAGLLALAPNYAMAQQPCTTDARRVVDELYRHMLERTSDSASQNWVEKLNSGTTVRAIVREIARSQERQYQFRIWPQDADQNPSTPSLIVLDQV